MMKTFTKIVLLLSIVINTAGAWEKKTVIGLIGDSTVADTYGWGPAFAKKVTDRTKVLNFAKNGATLESLSAKLDELLKKKPDYVFIQFGHNDQKRYDTDVYSAKLKSYVDRIKEAGAKAVIFSSVTRRRFDENGKIKPAIAKLHGGLPAFAKAAQAVAKEEGVPFLDLYSISVAHHNKIGPEESATYNFEGTDTTHFSPKGANAIADLIVAELKTVVPELKSHLK